MNAYETIFVLDPQLEDEPINKQIVQVEHLITARHGEIVGTERWGRRKLQYEINKRQQGFYTLIRFNADSTVPAELERVFKLNEAVLRHVTVRVKSHEPSHSRLPEDDETYDERSRYRE
ncbi:MAG: 30S ribosomal protein S6 [Candidatus Latescibacteria bacterium]|nr:30S ribosomal protein S6 [Candidatus Latescibacterota bacterium]